VSCGSVAARIFSGAAPGHTRPCGFSGRIFFWRELFSWFRFDWNDFSGESMGLVMGAAGRGFVIGAEFVCLSEVIPIPSGKTAQATGIGVFRTLAKNNLGNFWVARGQALWHGAFALPTINFPRRIFSVRFCAAQLACMVGPVFKFEKERPGPPALAKMIGKQCAGPHCPALSKAANLFAAGSKTAKKTFLRSVFHFFNRPGKQRARIP